MIWVYLVEHKASGSTSLPGDYLALVVQRVDNSIHRINHPPVDGVLCFVNIYPLDSDLSGGECYTPFEQPDPELRLGVEHSSKHFKTLFGGLPARIESYDLCLCHPIPDQLSLPSSGNAVKL